MFVYSLTFFSLKWKKIFYGGFFIVAGALGVAASLTAYDPSLTNALNLASVHFFFFEAISLYCTMERGLRLSVRVWTITAIVLFGLGSLLDGKFKCITNIQKILPHNLIIFTSCVVIGGYIETFSANGGEYTHWVVVMAVFDNCCWVASALIMTGLTIYEEQDDVTDKSSNYNENPVFGTTN